MQIQEGVQVSKMTTSHCSTRYHPLMLLVGRLLVTKQRYRQVVSPEILLARGYLPP
jgi:hypothetical protein